MPKLSLHLLSAGAAILMAGTMASAAPQEVKGIIVTNQNGLLTVKTEMGNQAIQIGPGARIQSVSGPLGGQKQTVPVSALIPGLPISVDGDEFHRAADRQPN